MVGSRTRSRAQGACRQEGAARWPPRPKPRAPHWARSDWLPRKYGKDPARRVGADCVPGRRADAGQEVPVAGAVARVRPDASSVPGHELARVNGRCWVAKAIPHDPVRTARQPHGPPADHNQRRLRKTRAQTPGATSLTQGVRGALATSLPRYQPHPRPPLQLQGEMPHLGWLPTATENCPVAGPAHRLVGAPAPPRQVAQARNAARVADGAWW